MANNELKNFLIIIVLVAVFSVVYMIYMTNENRIDNETEEYDTGQSNHVMWH